MRKSLLLLLALPLALTLLPVEAQTPVFCPTRPPGTTGNACASVDFVAAAVAGGAGDVVGPSASRDADLALFDGTTGKLIDTVRGVAGIPSINRNTVAVVGGPATILALQSADGAQNALRMDAFLNGSPSNLSSYILGRVAGGTAAAPTFTPSGFEMFAMIGRGYDSVSGYSSQDAASIAFETAQDWIAGANGTRTRFFITPTGTALTKVALHLDATTSNTMRSIVGVAGESTGMLTLSSSGGGSASIQAAAVGSGTFLHTFGSSSTNSILTWKGDFTTQGPVSIPVVTQGDLFYGFDTVTGTIAALAKNTTATRYLSNTGTSNNPAWAQVNLANGVTGTLPIANGGTADTGTAWSAYTPTLSCAIGTLTSAVGATRYKTLGKTVWFTMSITITTNGTCAGSIRATLPNGVTAGSVGFVFAGKAALISGSALTASVSAAGTIMIIADYLNAYPGADGEVITVSGTFETN